MSSVILKFILESAATFGLGDGIPGLVDQETAVDSLGCPYLHGRTLKGLMSEVCADILAVLPDPQGAWLASADKLFGTPGSKSEHQGAMIVGNAQLPADIRSVIEHEVASWSRADVRDALSGIRRQTAIEASGVPDPNSLRSVRVILRSTSFEAHLQFRSDLNNKDKALLAAITRGFRRAGSGRNRGRGRLVAALYDKNSNDITDSWFNLFKEEVTQ